MSHTNFKNNQVTITGEVVSEFAFNHEIYGERFFLTEISVERKSGQCDIIPVMVSERLLDMKENYIGRVLAVHGQYRSFNKHDGEKARLLLSVFARHIEVFSKEDVSDNPNKVILEGYVCKKPIYRKTPLGREITEILLAVNRPYGKSDYVPCICWGRNARFTEQFSVGAHVQCEGRIQSREYRKKLGEDEYELRVAYEVSVSRLSLIDEV